MTEYEIKKQICDIGKRIYDRGMVAANDGNISVKINDNEFLCTPTGVSKGFMTPEYICKIDKDGNVLQANKGFKPSSEIKMHLRVYQQRPDVKAVVHAHWVEIRQGLHICSNCKVKASLTSDEYDYMEDLSGYCHRCGAQMDEVVE